MHPFKTSIAIALNFMEIEPQPTVPSLTETRAETLEFAEPPVPLSLTDKKSPSKLNLKLPESTDAVFSPLGSVEIWENDSKPVSTRSARIAFLWRSVSDRELRNPRIQAGLTCVGFGALGLVFLLLYTRALHPEFDWVALVNEYWYPYAGFASLGVAGLIMLGRESLRSYKNSEE
ncbi:MAG: hypothetical protein WBA24_01045 [Geitlerinemataceae cyanobacterium]